MTALDAKTARMSALTHLQLKTSMGGLGQCGKVSRVIRVLMSTCLHL